MKNNITFKEQYEHTIKVRKANENSWFGIIFGIIISAFSAYQSLCTIGIVSVLFNVLAAMGLIMIILGSFFPASLSVFIKIARKTGAVLGNIVLKIMIIPVYFLMALVNVITNKRYSEKFEFARWDNSEKYESSFNDHIELKHKSGRFITVDIINSIIDFFVVNKTFIIIPIVVLLLILGLIVFFASSNVVFSFVYTLF